jgi:ubiquinone/menaquinone biosynthesis C-methylase UbiE
MPAPDEIAAYYNRGEEQERLAGVSRLELVRTKDLLERHLPAPPAVVVDVGGGPGAYALWLAERGYEVHLLDAIELHVDQARAAAEATRARLASAVVGDARELPQGGGSADVVLLLGPLYHLQERADRLRALREARRVLRPGGLLAAAAISRFASTVDGLARGFFADPRFEAIVERDLRDGHHLNPERHERWFTTAYFHLPGEFEDEVREAGFDLIGVLAVEGPGENVRDLDDWLDDPARREALLRAIRRVEAEPTMIGASPHLLALARLPS